MKNFSSMRIIYVLIVVLSVFISYFNLFYYPIVSDNFDFWHVAKIISVDMSGHIEPNYQNAGYYAFGVIVTKLSSLPDEMLPTLPLQAIAVIFISIALLKEVIDRRSSSNFVILLVMLIFVTKFGNKSYFMYYCHGLGFVLAITLCLTLLLYLKTSSFKNRQILSALIILIVVSLNYISYKLVFFSIILLLSVQIIDWIYTLREGNEYHSKISLAILTIFSIVYTLAFNQILYQGLIPRLQETMDSPFSGLSKLLISFHNSERTPFDAYYFTYAVDVRNALVIWLVLLLLTVFIVLIYLTYKVVQKKGLSNGERVTFGFIIASIAIFIVYNFLGLSVFEFIVCSGYIGYLLLYDITKDSKKYQDLIIVSLIILLALNSYITIESCEDQYKGLRDYNNYHYISVPTDWCIQKAFYENQGIDRAFYTDVFTGGFIETKMKRENIKDRYYPRTFSKDQMSLLLLDQGSKEKGMGDIYIINYKLRYFSAKDWNTFDSWLNCKSNINGNPYINSIYSSGYIEYTCHD